MTGCISTIAVVGMYMYVKISRLFDQIAAMISIKTLVGMKSVIASCVLLNIDIINRDAEMRMTISSVLYRMASLIN